MSTKQKVLFLYPNERDMSLVPPAIALFSTLLKQDGHRVDLFDCTGYELENKRNPDTDREKNLFFKSILPTEKDYEIVKEGNIYADFLSKIETFNPDLIAVSVTESTFERAIALLNFLRNEKQINILTIIGGVFPTFSPEFVINFPEIDILCVGEGEKPLTELVNNLAIKKSIYDIANLWIKTKNNIIKNNPVAPININELPDLDFSIFEQARLYRPMRGQIYRMLPVETHRGCPYTCSFCNSPSQNDLFGKNFFRKKSPLKIKEELENFKNKWNGEYIFFWADTFLSWDNRDFYEFCEIYSEYKFPFWCQTRPETIAKVVDGEKKLKALRHVGLHHISFGLEHGNEKFRREIINRNFSNIATIEALTIPKKLEIPFTINNIIGFPKENYKLAFDTIELNRHIDSFNLSCSTFAPYQGTGLRTLSEKLGYIKKDTITPSNTHYSILNMPEFSQNEIYSLQRTFNMYVKFPKNRWKEIKQAENLTPEGDRIWENLRLEFKEKYFKEPEVAINKVNSYS